MPVGRVFISCLYNTGRDWRWPEYLAFVLVGAGAELSRIRLHQSSKRWRNSISTASKTAAPSTLAAARSIQKAAAQSFKAEAPDIQSHQTWPASCFWLFQQVWPPLNLHRFTSQIQQQQKWPTGSFVSSTPPSGPRLQRLLVIHPILPSGAPRYHRVVCLLFQ